MLRVVRRILPLGVFMIAGCSTMSLVYTKEEGWHWVSGDQTRQDTMVDRAWRSGGGMNNPNPDRIRQGKPPLNFDGSAYKP